MTIPLSINIFERGTSGVPSTDTFLYDLKGRVNSLTFSITDRGGFESAQFPFTVTVAEALEWFQTGLMRYVIICGPEGETCWEGLIFGISATIGQKSVHISLDGMANKVRVKYTTVLGTPATTSATSNAASQLLFGVKDHVVSLDNDISTAATNKAAIVLADLAFPKSQEATQALTGEIGDIQLTIDCAGWYTTLGWVVLSRTSTTNTAISSQVGTLISGSAPGIGATNAFISTSTVNIMTVSNTATEYVEADTTYREKIEALLGQGTGTYPVAWGVFESREFYVSTWAGATPETVTYQEYVGDANIYDAYGNIVKPWNVRPNAIVQTIDLLDAGPSATAPDAAARKYVGRTACTVSGDSVGVSLEPAGYDAIDARLAAMPTKGFFS